MSHQTERVHLKTPLRLSNPGERPSVRFGVNEWNNLGQLEQPAEIRKLVNLVNRTPSLLDPLTVTRVRKDTAIALGTDDSPKLVTNTTMEGSYEGVFEIPWVAMVSVDRSQVSLEYEARLQRPDSSLVYILEHSKKPEFLGQPGGCVRYSSYPKSRTRVDGLLVWIRIDEWEDDRPENKFAPEPKRLALTHKHSKPQPFRRVDGQSAMLEHTDRFIGKWQERWSFVDVGAGPTLSRMAVVLEGNWE